MAVVEKEGEVDAYGVASVVPTPQVVKREREREREKCMYIYTYMYMYAYICVSIYL